MQIYAGDAAEILKVDAPHDPDALLFYGLKYKPETWQANKVYNKRLNVVVPTTPNGFLYKVNSNGTSGATEPSWDTVKNELTADNTVEFKAVEYNIFLYDSETLTASTWTATDSVPVTLPTFTAAGETQAKFGPIPDGVTEFTITNHVTKNNTEEDDRSMIITVKER